MSADRHDAQCSLFLDVVPGHKDFGKRGAFTTATLLKRSRHTKTSKNFGIIRGRQRGVTRLKNSIGWINPR
jgi:hypothetical protein